MVFLTPAEFLDISSEIEDVRSIKKRLKDELREERRILQHRYKEKCSRLEGGQKVTEENHITAPGKNELYRVETPVTRKLLTSILVIYFLSVFCVDVVFMYYQYTNTKEMVIQELKNSGILFQQNLGQAVWYMDEIGIKAVIAGMLEHPLIIGVRVFDKYQSRVGAGGMFQDTDGNYVIFKDSISVDPDEKAEQLKSRRHSAMLIFSHTFPIIYHEQDNDSVQEIGKATIYSSGRFVFKRLTGGYVLLLMNSLFVALTLIVTLIWKSRKILDQPLSVLTNAVTSLNLKNLDSLEINLPTSEKNELKILETAFNRMVKNLIEEQQVNIHITRTFEKFIPKQLLSRIAVLGIQSIRLGSIYSEKMTVLYCRFHTSENILQSRDTSDMFNRLNEYISKMNKAIEKHGGFMYKYSNDDIMAFFNLNDPPLEALSSVYAAIDMQNAIKNLNQQEARRDAPISISIGIDCGDIGIGTIGSENRIEATGIGNAINAAVRLQRLTRQYQTQILITEHILKPIKSFQTCLTREVDSINISETGEPLLIFEVFDAEPLREVKQQLIPSFQEGLQLYRAKRWEDAKKNFEACLAIYPKDVVSKLYLVRCQANEAKDEIAVFLRNECGLSPILRELETLDLLVGDFELATFEDGDCILDVGDSGIRFCLIFEGMANVYVKNEKGCEIQVVTLEKGESFGEIYLLTGDPVSATIKSAGTSRILTMNRDRFDNMVRQYPELSQYFYKQYSKYLAGLHSALID
jgi:class 3 adenylate cyclase/HAMP domain-containing protein